MLLTLTFDLEPIKHFTFACFETFFYLQVSLVVFQKAEYENAITWIGLYPRKKEDWSLPFNNYKAPKGLKLVSWEACELSCPYYKQIKAANNEGILISG